MTNTKLFHTITKNRLSYLEVDRHKGHIVFSAYDNDCAQAVVVELSEKEVEELAGFLGAWIGHRRA